VDLSRAAIDNTDNVIYLLNTKKEVVYCNPAWDRFAAENGGEAALASRVVGSSIFDVIPEPLRRFYEDVYELCTGESRIITFNYHCSSPVSFRLFQMQVVPQTDACFAVVNSLIVEHAHDEPGAFPSPKLYEDPEAMVTMCSHCRRTRRVGAENTWDWVPAHLSRRSMSVSHGLCPICRAHYYHV
jgi:hypothetical protein